MTAPKFQARHEIAVFDKKNPRSVYNIVTPAIRDAIDKLPSKYMKASEKQLTNWCEPGHIENQIRICFWNEYEYAQDNMCRMRAPFIYQLACSKDHFYNVILESSTKVAWMLHPPQDYMLSMEELLMLSVTEMRDILTLPNRHTKPGKNHYAGEPNTKIIDSKIKIFALLDNRVKGAVKQKLEIEQRSMSINVNAEAPPQTVGQVEKELKSLDNQIKKLESSAYQPDIIEQVRSQDASITDNDIKEAQIIGRTEETQE